MNNDGHIGAGVGKGDMEHMHVAWTLPRTLINPRPLMSMMKSMLTIKSILIMKSMLIMKSIRVSNKNLLTMITQNSWMHKECQIG